MKRYNYPPKDQWNDLISRPVEDKKSLEGTVGSILREIRERGDSALLEFTQKYDCNHLSELTVKKEEILNASGQIPEDLKSAITTAYNNIEKFHRSQQVAYAKVETSPGVTCWRKETPIDKVGFYIPGGSAPLFSTVLMLAIPAGIAGCREVIICTPPDQQGGIDPAILYTADLCGIEKIFKAGGAQAIGAMAYGTETVPAVDKIFGPGNQYVTTAKQLVAADKTAIDLPAGPSEVLVVADRSANPAFIAADLLSQAEHGTDSQVVLVTEDETICDKVIAETERQLSVLPRKEIAVQTMQNSLAVVLKDLGECIAFSNRYAPEHLILSVQDPDTLAEAVTNAGSVFLGHFTPESAGDYASGTNHTLPTNGLARAWSGISLQSFTKTITFQKITEDGLKKLGPVIEEMASAEKLDGHKNAVNIRLSAINERS